MSAPLSRHERGWLVLFNRHAQRERADPLAGVVRLLEELRGEVRVAERAARVHGVAEGDGAAIVPAVAVTLDGRVRLALKRERQRLLLERVTRDVVVPAEERGGVADEPDVPVRVVEDERDGLLALLHVLRRRLAELLKQRGEDLILEEVGRLLGELLLLVGGGVVVDAPEGDEAGDGEQDEQRGGLLYLKVAHELSPSRARWFPLGWWVFGRWRRRPRGRRARIRTPQHVTRTFASRGINEK